MKKTRAQRKALREAKKKRRLEIARIRWETSNHSAKYLICLSLAAVFLAGAAVCVSLLLQLYAAYRYETSVYSLELPRVNGPCYMLIEIGYQREPPTNIRLELDGVRISPDDLIISDNAEGRILSIGYDTDVPSDKYVLTVRPEANTELSHRTTFEPSYRYAECGAEPYRDGNGDLWIDLTCMLKRLPKAFYCEIACRGDQYGRIAFKGDVPQAVRYPLNISELARRQATDLGKCEEIRITFSMDTETDVDPDSGMYGRKVDEIEIILALADWPEYDESESRAYSPQNTETYLQGR